MRPMIAADMDPVLREAFKQALHDRGVPVRAALTVLAEALLAGEIPEPVLRRMLERSTL